VFDGGYTVHCCCTVDSDAPRPTFTPAPVSSTLSALRPLSIADVTAAVCQLLNKQCAIDPLPTRLLKDNVDLLAVFVTTLFNKSVTSGTFPATFKTCHNTTAWEGKFGPIWPTVIPANIQLGALKDWNDSSVSSSTTSTCGSYYMSFSQLTKPTTPQKLRCYVFWWTFLAHWTVVNLLC